MNTSISINLIFIFVLSLITLLLLRRVAKHPFVGLVDKPNERKLHKGAIPLVGGISICISILYFIYNNTVVLPYSTFYVFSIIVLVIVGGLDDKFDLCFKWRMGIQTALAFLMMMATDTQLANLGDLIGAGDFLLPVFLGKVITVLAVLGAINAFNMVDGIDGLLGGLASITFGGLGVLFYINSAYDYAYFCAMLIVVMLPYILFNLGFMGKKRKVFMGDAGSMLIGFTVIFLLICATQPAVGKEILRPVTALWLIAVPLMDMSAIMYRRIRRGDSPFKPDREHLHHIFQRIGFNSRQTLFSICLLSLGCASIGILSEIYKVPEPIMFYLFIILFLIYSLTLSHIWIVIKKLRKLKFFIKKSRGNS